MVRAAVSQSPDRARQKIRAGTVGARWGSEAMASQARSSAPVSRATSKARRKSSGVVAPQRRSRAAACSKAPKASSLSIRTCRQLSLAAGIDRGCNFGQKDGQEQLAQRRQVVIRVGDQTLGDVAGKARAPKIARQAGDGGRDQPDGIGRRPVKLPRWSHGVGKAPP